MRRTIVLALILTTGVLAACGSDQPVSDPDSTSTVADPSAGGVTDSKLDDVTVTGDPGEKPVLEFDQPFGVAETGSRVLIEGAGDPVVAGTTVSIDYVIVNATNGAELDTSYGAQPASLPIDGAPAFLVTGLTDQKVGARVLIAIAAKDGFGANEQRGVAASDTLLMVADVLGVATPLSRAEGVAVPPVIGLPEVKLDGDGAPTITVPAGDPPTDLVAQPLIQGTGAVVESGQSITVHYTGVLWNDGTVFDSSWTRGSPATFSIGTGNVIVGWDEGLVGRTVGSQILLVVPPAKGYPEGKPDGSIKATDTLVFVVDILAAS